MTGITVYGTIFKGYKPPLPTKKRIYINKYMPFTVFNFGLLNFESDSLIWKVSVKRCKNNEMLLKIWLKQKKTHHRRSRNQVFLGRACPHTRLEYFLTLDVHQSLDSYVACIQNFYSSCTRNHLSGWSHASKISTHPAPVITCQVDHMHPKFLLVLHP